MKKEWILISAMSFALLCSGVAEAQGASKIRRNGPSLRINKAPSPIAASSRATRMMAPRSASSAQRTSPRFNVGRSPSRAGSLPGLGSANRNGVPLGLNGALGGGSRLGNNGPLGGLLQQFLYNEYGGGRHYDPYAGEKAHAKAYRDAAIANAVVNMVGILATTHQQRQYTQCATSPAPRGHVERQRILVQEGRTEEYQVWVPQYTIPSTGEVVVGHHETRRREIAPVYEEREVWIPAP